ncbi:2-succinyl-5-enolpyruvyl-6-hydroxy-3-cyclohexene-1-carboxylic-acid synthase [Herbiconiux sp. L3-i23]|uniref:2-succinyl-5-enolpyruvyl-6-hydroxy-3- cyclohexene-1-carboxylic-acid synthase n=1 Tax=Herbiconiux sp. L3-i23 TaxID=2905871 RepID=UPI00205FB1B8|nr:2-succinyl-5-enolpyruvyl-6-hydroxy-3-cyclohexene-1-carboxylic-acid synthase [Herbiconiux sp. L3-i23]BDI21363.1 2-succinyl-5-enolpyruvyl-6-hydroxy-3-cyclohexene- 1-carboxylate synthase [Herbiconiux sp. L3-i23]
MPDAGNPASVFATALLRRLAAHGMRHVVLSPGSRSQALALAAAHAEKDGLLTVHVRIDERSAGFLALGLTRASGTPVAVITTSGTAVANLHPAMLEAWHFGDPLIAITADRPAELRGRGANQTTTQPGIFGPAATWEVDVAAPTGGDADVTEAYRVADDAYEAALVGQPFPAPVHINLALRDPLSGPADIPSDAPVRSVSRGDGEARLLDGGLRTVVVAGAGAGPAAESLAREAQWPLLAEVTSSARFGPSLVPAYRRVLGDAALVADVERVVVFGRPNLSRQVPALLSRSGVEVVVVRAAGAEQFDPAARAEVVDAVALTDGFDPDRAWLGRWIVAGRALDDDGDDAAYIGGSGSSSPAERNRLVRSELDAIRAPISRRYLVDAVWRASWPHDRLWLAASRLVREADASVPGKKIWVHSSRGLAGIDGTISSALGLALAAADDPRGAAGTTRVLLGDLAFLHDVGGLLLPPGEARPRIQLIVGNDRGGSIFDGLEVAATADPDLFDRVLYTPHTVDIAALAQAYGWEYLSVSTRGDLDRALTSPAQGPSILEVPLGR